MSSLDQDLPSLLLESKTLNNRAALFIEAGQYRRAINNIVKAMKITEEIESHPTCSNIRGDCSLEECLAHSRKVSWFDSKFRDSLSKEHSTKSLSKAPATSAIDDFGGYIYRQPIRVPPRAMKEDYSMGLTLPLILTFNLALAYHLKALKQEVVERKTLKKVLQLYELAYRWQMNAHEEERVDSIQFTLIISNNLGEIHRVANNKAKHERCLQHLLSTLMFVIDCQQTSDCAPIELDGFLRNTSRLFFREQCAAAA